MIRLVFLLVVLGLGLFAGTQFAGQQGYVLISVAHKTIEMSVTTLVVLVIAILAVLFGLEYVVKKILRASSFTWNWFSVRKTKRARRYTNEGIIKLLEGDWTAAEKKVTRWAKHHDMPVLCYLIASEAAQEMGNKDKREHYLELAGEEEYSSLAVKLTRARQLVRERAFTAAEDILSDLKSRYPNNAMVLSLLKTTYTERKEWKLLLRILPKLVKYKIMTAEEATVAEGQALEGILIDKAAREGSEGVLEYWSGLAKKWRQSPVLVHCLVQLLIEKQADNEAFTVAKEMLKKRIDEGVVALLPSMKLPDRYPVVILLEGLLKSDPDNAIIHSTLGQIHLEEEEWALAQLHFERALSIRSDVSDYAHLAKALEKQDFTKAARDVSKQALKLVEVK